MNVKNKSQKSKKGKIVLKIFGVIICVLVLFFAVTALITVIGNRANIQKALSFPTVEYENQLQPYTDDNGFVTFTTDNDLRIMQLTDVHIGGGWLSLKKDAQALNAVAALVTAEKPDLVIVTGDIAYPVPFQSGTLNNKSGAKIFACLMEQLGVYWTMSFGNHDTELYSYYSREDISDYYESGEFKYCVYRSGPENVDGEGNQIINIKNSAGIITQSLFLLDSHAYTDNDYLGFQWKYDNIHENQIEWYTESIGLLNAENDELYSEKGIDEKSNIKSLVFFHIPPTEMKAAWDEYVDNGYSDTEDVKLVSGFAGGSGKMVYCPVHEDDFIETLIASGSAQGVFFGHDHRNCLSFDYKGLRLTYGMSIDYLAIPGIWKIGSQRGCTMITVSPDGTFDCKPENYYQEKYTSLYDKEEITLQDVTYPAGENAPVTNEYYEAEKK